MDHWFTADMHLGHANIIKYCDRPFSSLEEMNRILIRNWNARVKPEDIVFHIGDFCFKNTPGGKKGEGVPISARDWEKQLNGKIIHIKGNHDKNNSCKTIITNLTIWFGNKRINLVHDPAYAGVNYKLNFVGHIHEKWEIKRVKTMFGFTDCINVGVDVWNFKPTSYNEIMSRYYKWLSTQGPKEFKS